MKNVLRRFVPMLVALFLTGGSAWAQTRVGTVDLSKLFDGYWKTKQAKAALADRMSDLQKEDKDLKENLKKSNEEYQKLLASANDQAVSGDERDKRKKAAEAKLKDIKETEDTLVQFQRQADTTFQEQKRRMRENILVEVKNMVTARAKAAGYQIVLDTAAQSADLTPIVVFTSGENDLTAAVLEQLNATAPVETSKPAEKKAEKKDEGKEKK